MALVSVLLISLTILLHMIAAQQTSGSVSVGASLTATPDAKPWLSSSAEFVMGFQQVQDKDFLLSIWYDKIPDKTIVWYPKGGPTVSAGSKVELVDRRGLVLSDPQGKEVWSSKSISDLAYGHMNDTGNFVIVGGNSRNIWDSFDHPTDTMLPTQVMARGGEINSKMSQMNFTSGRFQLRMLQDGNLVLNPRDMYTGLANNPYYASGTFDASNSMNSEDSPPSGDYYHRATLDSDGVFTQYHYPKNPTEPTNWRVTWLVPEDICKTRDSKACGLNNVCSLEDNRPTCECPKGFSLVDNNTLNGDCKPYFTPSCDKNESNDVEDVFDFIELTNIDWPYSDFVSLKPSSEQNCRTSCLKDCLCVVAIYRDNQSWKKQLPLQNGHKDPALIVKALLKFRKIDGPPETRVNISGTEDKSRRSLIFIGSALLGTSLSHLRKSVIFDDDTQDVVALTDLAWDCYEEGKLDVFVKNDLEALDELEKLTAYMMVGLWCVQKKPALRPTMKKVIQMLEGGIEVTEPPCPCPFSVNSYKSLKST
ncbi:hypothetical protein R6Q59_024296 [Mikania micrantha]